MANTITLSDFRRALLLIPIITELGIDGAKRFVEKNSLTDDELVTRSQEFQADTQARNEEFRFELSRQT